MEELEFMFPSMNEECLIELKNISFKYNQKNIFKDLNFSIGKDQKIIIYANNSSGKTSFLDICAGFIKAYSGERLIKNNLKIGYLFQNPDIQNISITVEEELYSVCRNFISNEEEIESRVNTFMNYFEINHLGKRDIIELSGGEKQMIALLSNLIAEPDVILLDEPFSMIDKDSRKKIIDILNSTENSSIIMTTSSFYGSLKFNGNFFIENKKILKISCEKKCNYLFKKGIFEAGRYDYI